MAMRQVPVDASQPASRVQPHHHRNRANHQQTASPIRQFKPSILTRLHAGYFRISLSLASQALLLKMLTQPAAAQVLLSALYALRCCFHFQLVKAEFFHHVGVNYLFAPWISWLVLLLSSPTAISEIKAPYLALWWAFAIPVVLLDVKIYGQWFTTEKRFLSMVANPTSLISVIGNLRLSGGDRLPAMLRPVFFLFFAAPSMASLAWNSISGTFDTGSKMLFFLSLFLFASLVSMTSF
ncbi:hypothetical protein CRG98_009060 [Punica granatum]|uniref:Uncharacterized protein n=1 Tax=Punica granatum TaxID=22663 RepID=A0A2I0KPY7_PUNGR|nr:hypothetical protein CRG98_009060 [Punica granatum]